MSYAILWLSCLATGILIVAFTVALSTRRKKPFWQRSLPLLVALALLFWSALITFIFGLFWGWNISPLWLFPYALSLSVAFIVCAFFVLRKGLRKKGEEHVGRTWPRARLAAALGLVLSLNIATYLFIDLGMRMKMSDLWAEATARAVSVLPPKLPESQNAARFYARAYKTLTGETLYYNETEKTDYRKIKKLPNWFYQSNDPDFDPGRSEVSQFLQENKEVVDLLYKAVALSGYNQDIHVETMLLSPYPRFFFGDFAKLLNLSARSKIRKGDPEGSIKDLAAVQRMAEHLLFTNSLCFHAYVVDRIRTSGFEYVLTHISPQHMDLIDTPVKRSASVKPHFLNTFRLDEAAELQFFASFGKDALGAMKRYHETIAYKAMPIFFQILNHIKWMGAPVTQFYRVFFAQADLESFPQKWAKTLELAAIPYPRVQNDLRAWEKSYETEPCGPYAKFILGYNMMDALKYEIWIMNRMEACRGLADLALAATAYRVARGHYPSRLEDLVPDYIEDIPFDPFDGKPLKIEKVQGGLDLYSVGPDPKDLEEGSRWGVSIHFYLGREAYEKYRVEPAKLKRAKEAEERLEREKKRKTKPGTILKKKRKTKRKK